MRCRQQWVENLEARQLFAGLSTEVVLGGSGSLTVNASKALTDGSYVIAGTFSGKIDFQPKGGSEIDAVASDGFIASYSVRDKLLWVDTFVGEGTQSINAISIDPRNNDIVYAGVATDSTLVPVGNGLQTIIPQGNQDLLLGRMTSGGKGIRATMIGGADATITPSSIDVNSDGTAVVGGSMRGTVDFSTGVDAFPISAPSHQTAGFVAVYEPKNALDWVDALSVKKNDNSIVQASWKDTTGVYVVGNINGAAKLGASSTGYAGTSQAALFAELDSAGSKVFFDVLAGTKSVSAFGLLPTATQVLVGGDFNDSVDLNPGNGKFTLNQPVTGAGGSTFVGSYSVDGTLQNGFALGASSVMSGQTLVDLNDKGFGVVGQYKGSADLDPSVGGQLLVQSRKKTVKGKKKLTSDVFFAGFNSDLSFLTGASYGTTANESVTAASYNPVTKSVAAAILPNNASGVIDTEIDLAVLT